MPADRFDTLLARTPALALKVKARGPVAPTVQAVEPQHVDVAQFRILPLSGAPQVSAAVDETLGKTGLLPFFLTKLEGMGRLGVAAANGVRLLTRVLGPIAFLASAVWNFRLFQEALRDPDVGTGSKVVLGVGTLGAALGAITATAAALPAKLAGWLSLGPARQLLANKVSGIAGGLAGVGFAAINLIETMRKPDAKPGERFFAKAGFAVGLAGFVAGTTALVLSMGAGAAVAPWLLPIASQVATIAGLAGIATWIGQLAFGKNAWLNAKLQGTWLG